MNILAIESASIICGTALFLNNKLVEIDELNKSKVHSEKAVIGTDSGGTAEMLIV